MGPVPISDARNTTSGKTSHFSPTVMWQLETANSSVRRLSRIYVSSYSVREGRLFSGGTVRGFLPAWRNAKNDANALCIAARCTFLPSQIRRGDHATRSSQYEYLFSIVR